MIWASVRKSNGGLTRNELLADNAKGCDRNETTLARYRGSVNNDSVYASLSRGIVWRFLIFKIVFGIAHGPPRFV